MNQDYKRRLVRVVYKVPDSSPLDKYGTKIFRRPIKGSWKIFRHIIRMAIPSNRWVWMNKNERVCYPSRIVVPTFEDFATIMFHEAAHGWCSFLKEEPFRGYRGKTDEEQVCWDVSRLVCRMLDIPYQNKLAEMGYKFHLLTLAKNEAGLDRLMERLPEHFKY